MVKSSVFLAYKHGLLIFWLIEFTGGYEKQFIVYKNQYLTGCSGKSVKVTGKTLQHCAQVCLSKGWSCQSFNYNSESMKCKLNSCKFGVAGTHLDVTLIDDSSHSYVEVKSASGIECQTSQRKNTCNSAGTRTCLPGIQLGEFILTRVCQCNSFASGDDCSEINTSASEDVAWRFISSPLTASAAELSCSATGGHMLTVNSDLEQSQAELFMSRYTGVILLGLQYNDLYQDFAYTGNKQPLTGYTNWLEEKNATERRGCVKLSSVDNYKWVDVDCSTELPSICVEPVCGSGGQVFNGSCYYVASTESKWSTQHDLCYDKDHRSRLATIQSKEYNEYAELITTLTQNALGLHDYMIPNAFQWIHNEWVLIDFDDLWEYLGCYNTYPNFMGTLEDSHSLLMENYELRGWPIDKCCLAAKSFNYSVFAIESGGICKSSEKAYEIFPINGKSSGCQNGVGGNVKEDVYRVKNRNLYYDFGFENLTSWNNRQRVYVWSGVNDKTWNGNDVTSDVGAICKTDSCPQGFTSFANKCFKILDKLQTRQEARDECQSYTGADLWNPEYSDESDFLSNHLSYLKAAESHYFWTGILEDSHDSTWKYEVMKKSINDNYNTYPIGAEPIYRDSTDSSDDGMFVEMRYKMPSAGSVIGWEYFSFCNTIGNYVKFSVVRQLQGDCQFEVVGANEFMVTAEGYNRVIVEDSERVYVQQGDLVAMSFTRSASIRYNWNVAADNECYTSEYIYQNMSSGNTISLNKASHWKRVYSFRALYRPTGYLTGSPVISINSIGSQTEPCTYADSANQMLLAASPCNHTYRAVCEIKRLNRYELNDEMSG